MTVFIQKGDAPLSRRQAIKRGLRYFAAQMAQWEREQGLVEGDTAYQAWAQQWILDNQENAANNLFNYQLHQYRTALQRLARFRLADGRSALYEDQPTGAFDPETGEALTESVLVQRAIDPLPAQIEQAIFDSETGEQIGTEMVPNPAIVADDAERAEAQALIDAAPPDIVDFAAANPI